MVTRQFMVFVVIGVLSALVDIACMEGLIFTGLHYGMATSVGFALGLVVNYIGHARVTFRAPSSAMTMIKFGIIVLANYLITMAFVIGFLHWFGSVLAGKVASLPVVAINGFLWSRYWVFK